MYVSRTRDLTEAEAVLSINIIQISSFLPTFLSALSVIIRNSFRLLLPGKLHRHSGFFVC